MTISEMHWELNHRYNKLNSNDKINLTPIELDAILNSAILKFVQSTYKGSAQHGILQMLDYTQQSKDILNPLVVTETHPYSQSFSIDNLNNKYLHHVRLTLTTNCGIFNVLVASHDDLSYILEDAFTQPSKAWRRVVATFNDNAINFYVPNNVTITNVNVTYLKSPVEVYFGSYSTANYTYAGYNSVEFNTSGTGYRIGDPPVHCDLPESYHDTVIEFALQLLSQRLYDNNQVQYSADNINKIL